MPANRDPRFEHWRKKIFGTTWIAYAGYYLTRKAFSAVKIELKKPEVLGLSLKEMSYMDGAYSACYAAGQFLWGTLGDRFGTRKVVLLGMMASILTAVGMGASRTAITMGVLFALQGIWQSSGWAPLAKNMGEFFSRQERGKIMGLWCTNYAVGGFVATTLAGFAAKQMGWRYAFIVPAAVLFGVWLLFYFFQRDRPEDVGLPPIETYHQESNASATPSTTAKDGEYSWAVVVHVLQNRMVWLLALVYFLIKPTRYLLMFWAPVLIHERLNTDTAASGFLSSLFDLAGPFGTLLGGVMSDVFFQSKRIPICVLALFAAAGMMILFPYLPSSEWAVGSAIFSMGFLVLIPDSLVSGTAAIDFGTKKGASTASGVINGFGSVGQMIGVTLPGLVEGFIGKGNNVWPIIFIMLGGALALAGILLLPQWNRLPPSEA